MSYNRRSLTPCHSHHQGQTQGIPLLVPGHKHSKTGPTPPPHKSPGWLRWAAALEPAAAASGQGGGRVWGRGGYSTVNTTLSLLPPPLGTAQLTQKRISTFEADTCGRRADCPKWPINKVRLLVAKQLDGTGGVPQRPTAIS